MQVKIIKDFKYWLDCKTVKFKKGEVHNMPNDFCEKVIDYKLAILNDGKTEQEPTIQLEELPKDIEPLKRGRKPKIQDKSLYHENE